MKGPLEMSLADYLNCIIDKPLITRELMLFLTNKNSNWAGIEFKGTDEFWIFRTMDSF